MTILRDFNFKISEIFQEPQVDIILIPEEGILTVELNSDKYERITLANFSSTFPVVVKFNNEHQIFGTVNKEFQLETGKNATFYFVKKNRTWYITL